MGLANSNEGYGTFTKLFHWLIVLIFALQYIGASIMTSIQGQETVLGFFQGFYYNWHKSLGLVALVIAVLRIINRQIGRLPNWAPTLVTGEKRFIHRAEQLLYLAMFVMPISGYIYVMAGGFGVELFGVWTMSNPIGKSDDLAFAAKWVHIISSYALALAVIGHVGLVLRHQIFHEDSLLMRMMPGRRG